MEHKAVAAASMIATLKIQHFPTKCKTNCLSLTKKSHQMPIKAFHLRRWMCNYYRYVFRGMLQIVGGCNVHPENELGRKNWGVKPGGTNMTYKSRTAVQSDWKSYLAPALKLDTLLRAHLLDPWPSLDVLCLVFYTSIGFLLQCNQDIRLKFLGCEKLWIGMPGLFRNKTPSGLRGNSTAMKTAK